VGQSASTLVLLAILALPIILIVSRQRAMKRQIAQVQSQLTVGVEVMTHSGLFGTIRALRDDSVEIEVAPGVVTTWARAAVNRVVTPLDDVDDGAASTDIDRTDPDQT
jgi:preprotein translocase subunit YajC